MDNFKNNKIIKRIISLMLCIALLITSVQVSNLINKDISGLDETQTDKKITSFIHSNIVIDADDLSAALYKLPYTIAVSMSDGTTEVISISEWKQYSDEGEKDSVHTYYYEMILDTNYELIPALKTPLAEINISQNKTSVQSLDDRLIVDDGVYEIKGTKEIPVCEHCYRVLSEQGLCPECNKKTSSCICEDIDIDLNNENSIHAWMKNNTPNFEFTSKKDTLGREILDYDDEWWDNLKSNQRILAETIYKHVVYNPDRPDLLCGYLSYCTIPELITFINNNRCNFDFSEHFKEHNSVIQYLTLEQLLQIEQIDPDLQFNDLEHMINYMNDHKSASDEQIRNVKAHIKLIDDDVFDVLKEVANTVISKSILTSSINKKYKTSILSNPSNYSLTLTASSAAACTDRKSVV